MPANGGKPTVVASSTTTYPATPEPMPANAIDILLLGTLDPLLRQGSDSSVARICGKLHTLIGDTGRADGYLADALAAYRQAREQAITLMEKAVSRSSDSPMTWLFDRLAASA